MTYQPVVAQPNQGGDLITRLSQENVNGTNYVVKRDWRRLMDAEVRREGHVVFAPDSDISEPDNMPGGSDEITLVHRSRKPNGRTAVIVGSKTTLYRYFSFEDGNVYEDDVYEPDVYQDLSGEWLVIGDNFSPDGNRWEAVDVAGFTIFNNGVDLPVIYDLGQLQVKPLYELREQGIAFVGTIAEFNGMLILGDVAELTEAGLTQVMGGRFVTSPLASQSGTTVTAASSEFTADDVGSTIIFANGRLAKILTFTSSTVVTVDTFQTVAAQEFFIGVLYGAISDETLFSRIQYRLLVSDIGDPEDYANIIPVTSANAGSTTVTLTHPTLTLRVGDGISILGAGPSGSSLQATITNMNGYRTVLQIDTVINTTATDTGLQKISRLESLSSAFDLQDDGSAIVRISELQGRLIVLKETSIFIGSFTGTDPLFTFQRIYSGPNSIGWKWMLAKIDGQRLIYAGSNSFYSFDLATLVPKIQEKLFLCQNLFYSAANALTLMNDCWATENVITNEIWFVFPTESSDKAICYDYQYNTCSTLAFPYSAGGSVERPILGNQIGVGEDWFVVGTSAGLIFQYGLTNLSTGIWTRDEENYDSTLKSGLFARPENFHEVDLRNYVIYFSGYPTTPVNITLYGTRNAHETATVLFSRDIDAPTYKNLIPTYFRKNYYQDKILVSGVPTNAAIVRRVLEFSDIDTRSAIRNNST